MSYEIICPYCFEHFEDDQVMFRSERVNQGDDHIIPDDYDDLDDFIARYRGADKEDIISRYRDWEFFAEGEDPTYEKFWRQYNGTTEVNPADKFLKVPAHRRKVLDPMDLEHQRYLMPQQGNDYFIRDAQGMVAQVELVTGEKCNRRVCPRCHNPLPDGYGKNPVKFATVIGITGAGKTVYLSQLLRRMQNYAARVGLAAVVNTPSAKNFVDSNVVADRRPLPGSTPAERLQQPIFYEMVRNVGGNQKQTHTFVLYDVAGEVFSSGESTLVHRFAPYVEHADGVIVLIDPMQFDVISSTTADREVLANPTDVFNTIHSLISHGDPDRKCDIPFAVCISKADTDEVQQVLSPRLRDLLLTDVRGVHGANGFNQPVFNSADYNLILRELTEFMQGPNVGDDRYTLANQLNTNYSKYSYFAFTALGCDVEEANDAGNRFQFPVGPVVPRRIEEPLLWLFHTLGYVGINQPIEYPNNAICPACGSRATFPLPPEDQQVVIREGLLRRRRAHVDTFCSACGARWDTVTGEVVPASDR